MPTRPEIVATVLYALGGTFELVFGFWLLFRGVGVPATRPQTIGIVP